MKKEKAIAKLEEQITKNKALDINDYDGLRNLHYQTQSFFTNFFGKDSVEVNHLENLYRKDYDPKSYISYIQICCDTIETNGLYNTKNNILGDLNNRQLLWALSPLLLSAFLFGLWVNSTFVSYSNRKTETDLELTKENLKKAEIKINQLQNKTIKK